MPATPRPTVAVVGSGEEDADLNALAEAVGAGLARAGVTVVTGGLGGVMAAASRGAQAAGGATLGILPGLDPREANEWVDVPVVTGLGEGRNFLVVRNAGAVVAVGGAYGTLSEIAFALKLGIPVIVLVVGAGAPPKPSALANASRLLACLDTWDLGQRQSAGTIIPAADPEEAVALALAALPAR